MLTYFLKISHDGVPLYVSRPCAQGRLFCFTPLLWFVRDRYPVMSDREIIKLILENLDTITDSQKPYNKKKDYEDEEDYGD